MPFSNHRADHNVNFTWSEIPNDDILLLFFLSS